MTEAGKKALEELVAYAKSRFQNPCPTISQESILSIAADFAALEARAIAAEERVRELTEKASAVLQALADKINAGKPYPSCSEDYAAAYADGRYDAWLMVQEAADNADHQDSRAERCLSAEEMKAQSERCSCGGADDYCPCQNSADDATRRARAALAGGKP